MVNWSLVSAARGAAGAALAAVLLLVAGCRTPVPVDVDGRFVSSPALIERSPAVVSVLPVEDGTESSVSRHLAFMRQELRRQLRDRLYAASTEQWVDASMRSAAPIVESVMTPANLERMAQATRDDAVLAVRVDKWDEATLLADRKVRFRFQAALVAKDGAQLWSGDLEGSVKAGGLGASPLGRDAAARSCIELAVHQLLLRLPDRAVR